MGTFNSLPLSSRILILTVVALIFFFIFPTWVSVIVALVIVGYFIAQAFKKENPDFDPTKKL